VRYLTAEERKRHKLNLGSIVTQGEDAHPYVPGPGSYSAGAGWDMFVMAPNGEIYTGSHKISQFHHSSILGGDTVACAGEIKIVGGQIVGLTNKSGHYKPTRLHLFDLLTELRSNGVDLSAITEIEVFEGTQRRPMEGNAAEVLQALGPEAKADDQKIATRQAAESKRVRARAARADAAAKAAAGQASGQSADAPTQPALTAAPDVQPGSAAPVLEEGEDEEDGEEKVYN
jgi:hypothetical protein